MGDKYDLNEYAYAKDVVKSFPLIEKELDRCYKILYDYQQYLCAAHVLDAIIDSKEMLKRQLKHYKKVLKEKGKDE